MSELTDAEVEAAAEAMCDAEWIPGTYAKHRDCGRWHQVEKWQKRARSALAVRSQTHCWVPREPGADFLSPGIYAVADILCASEYVNAPDASFVLALAHRAFADGYAVVLAGSPQPEPAHDPTNPFAPRERPKKSIRLMTDAERRAAGLDPNGGFDGPTGAD